MSPDTNAAMRDNERRRCLYSLPLYAILCLLSWNLLLIFRDSLYHWRSEQSDTVMIELTVQLQNTQAQLAESQSDVRVLAQHIALLAQSPRRRKGRRKGNSSSTLPSWSVLSLATRRLVHSISGAPDFISGFDLSEEHQPVNMPSIFSFMPHLLEGAESLRPAFHVTNPSRQRSSLVIGIPTVGHGDKRYLIDTINSLLYNMAPDEEDQVLIVICIAQVDMGYVMETAQELRTTFPVQIQSGLIELIAPAASYYPPDRNTTGPSQALDYAYLMAYCQTRGSLYLQLEDRVTVSRYGFVTTVFGVASNAADSWLLVDFGQQGMIGKLFRSQDLTRVVQFLVMFGEDSRPVDWLLHSYVSNVACFPIMDAPTCEAAKKKLWLRHQITMFEHQT